MSSHESIVEDLTLALVVTALANDGDLLPGDPIDDSAIDTAFATGHVATRRDYSDEYTTVMTDEGREFVRRTLNAALIASPRRP